MVLLRRIANLFSRGRIDAEIEAELQAHLELRIADNMAAGMSKQEARRDALRRFGNPVVIKERTTGIDAALNLAIWWFDVQYAWRLWRKSPVFAATTVITLALGIGTSTAIFSVTNVMLLRLMPVANPRNLYYLHVPGQLPKGSIGGGIGGVYPEASFSLPVFEALRKHQDAFSDVMAFAMVGDRPVRFGADAPEEVTVDMVSGNFFSGLGVRAALGRAFTMEDENQNAPVVVLSYAYWTRRFSRKPDLLGRTLFIEGIPFSIVGIAQEGFGGIYPGVRTDLWMPLQRGSEITGTTQDQTIYGSPNFWGLGLLARLTPGVSFEQAVTKVDPAYQAAAYAGLSVPDRSRRVQLTAFPARGTRGIWEDPHDGPIPFMMMLGMLVLVIACCNVAMFWWRGTQRARGISACAWRLGLDAGLC